MVQYEDFHALDYLQNQLNSCFSVLFLNITESVLFIVPY